MNTCKTLIIVLLLLANYACRGQAEIEAYNSLQEWNTDSTQLAKIINQNFEGGMLGFYQAIYSQIKYPLLARRNCKEGVALLRLTIEDAKSSLKMINKIGREFDQEIIKVFDHIKSYWKPSPEKISLNISIRFAINPEKNDGKLEKATLQILAYAMGRNLRCDAACDYRTNEFLEEMLGASIEYEDFESAILYLKELMRRFPFHKAYRKVYQETWKKIAY